MSLGQSYFYKKVLFWYQSTTFKIWFQYFEFALKFTKLTIVGGGHKVHHFHTPSVHLFVSLWKYFSSSSLQFSRSAKLINKTFSYNIDSDFLNKQTSNRNQRLIQNYPYFQIGDILNDEETWVNVYRLLGKGYYLPKFQRNWKLTL